MLLNGLLVFSMISMNLHVVESSVFLASFLTAAKLILPPAITAVVQKCDGAAMSTQ